MMTYNVTVMEDGRVNFPGIDFSNNKPITLFKRVKGTEFIIFKLPGGTCWSGVGSPRMSIPTRFMIAQIDKVEKVDGGVSFKITEITTFAPRNPKY